VGSGPVGVEKGNQRGSRGKKPLYKEGREVKAWLFLRLSRESKGLQGSEIGREMGWEDWVGLWRKNEDDEIRRRMEKRKEKENKGGGHHVGLDAANISWSPEVLTGGAASLSSWGAILK